MLRGDLKLFPFSEVNEEKYRKVKDEDIPKQVNASAFCALWLCHFTSTVTFALFCALVSSNFKPEVQDDEASDSSSDEEEQASAYQQLMSTLTSKVESNCELYSTVWVWTVTKERPSVRTLNDFCVLVCQQGAVVLFTLRTTEYGVPFVSN